LITHRPEWGNRLLKLKAEGRTWSEALAALRWVMQRES
jgi:hypothetical protein